MTETVVKSMLFSAPMVRAILADRKRETRRLAENATARTLAAATAEGKRALVWVRESFRVESNFDDAPPAALASTSFTELPVWHEAECGAPLKQTRSRWGNPFGRCRAGIHMPRWASRLTLAIEAVRLEPLQAIDDAGALAEGVIRYRREGKPLCGVEIERGQFFGEADAPRESYRLFWDHLHKDHPAARWEANPAVAVIRFYPIEQNIDAALRRGV